MALNGVVIFKGATSAGLIQNLAGPLPEGTRFQAIVNLTDGTVAGLDSVFAAVVPFGNSIVQLQNTDLSAKTFLAFF